MNQLHFIHSIKSFAFAQRRQCVGCSSLQASLVHIHICMYKVYQVCMKILSHCLDIAKPGRKWCDIRMIV